MGSPLSVLLLEDNPDDAELLVFELRRAGFDPRADRVDTEADLLNRLDLDLDIVLADYTLPQFSAPQVLEVLKQRKIDVPVIVVTGYPSEQSRRAALAAGAAVFLSKPFAASALMAAVQSGLAEGRDARA